MEELARKRTQLWPVGETDGRLPAFSATEPPAGRIHICTGCSVAKNAKDFPSRTDRGKTTRRKTCRACYSEQTAFSRRSDESKEKRRAYNREWAKANPDKKKQNMANIDTGKLRAIKAESKARRLLRYVPWADTLAIEYVYFAANAVNKVYGGQCPQVDHILPLQGDKVSGLHVASNLQLLSPSQNRKKHNSFAL